MSLNIYFLTEIFCILQRRFTKIDSNANRYDLNAMNNCDESQPRQQGVFPFWGTQLCEGKTPSLPPARCDGKTPWERGYDESVLF